MFIFLFKLLMTGLLVILWWKLKKYLKSLFAGSVETYYWSYRLRFSDDRLGKGKLKLRHSKRKGLAISFEAENLNSGNFKTVSTVIAGVEVLKIDSTEQLNGKKEVNETLLVEPMNGDQIDILCDGINVISSRFDAKQ